MTIKEGFTLAKIQQYLASNDVDITQSALLYFIKTRVKNVSLPQPNKINPLLTNNQENGKKKLKAIENLTEEIK